MENFCFLSPIGDDHSDLILNLLRLTPVAGQGRVKDIDIDLVERPGIHVFLACTVCHINAH